MEFENESLVSVKLFTKYERYRMGTSAISLPSRFSRYELSRLVNEALELEKPVPFDFIIGGKLLRVSLSEYLNSHNLSLESTIEVEYVPIVGKPHESSSDDLPDWISSIAVFESGYVVGCYDGTVHVYNKDDTLVAKKQVHTKPIKCVDIQNVGDVTTITSASLDNSLHILELKGNSIVEYATCTGHDSHVLSCSLNAKTGLVVSGAWNGSIFIWDTKRMDPSNEIEPIHTLSESMEGISSVKWWNENPVTGGWDHVIRVWDLETEGMIHDMKGNKVINSLDVNDTLKLIASCHPDGSVRLWDSRQEKANVLTFSNKHTFSSDVAWHPLNMNLVSSVDYDGSVTIFDIRSTFPLQVADHVHKGKAFAGVWKNEDMILTGGEDSKLKRLSVKRDESVYLYLLLSHLGKLVLLCN